MTNKQIDTVEQDERAAWRDHPAALDAKALATAQEIALMWGRDRSQFVSRIQVAVRGAMDWVRAAPLANEASKPAPSVEQDERGAFEAWARDEGMDLERGIIGAGAYNDSSTQACWRGWKHRARAASTSANVAQGAEHPDDVAVDRFAAAMKEKLAAARAKGRGGWQQCDPTELSIMLREHVEKGDPRDVANFCMFLWSLGQPISDAALPMGRRAAAPPAQTALTDADLRTAVWRIATIDTSFETEIRDGMQILRDLFTAAQSASGDTK